MPPMRRLMMISLALTPAAGLAFGLNTFAPRRARAPIAGLFDMFKPDEEAEARKEAEFRAQQDILARRRNPNAQQSYFDEMESRRSQSSKEAADKIEWQRQENVDPLGEFMRRKKEGLLNKMGYEDEEGSGGIPFPMASFGVGGEFGTGGKYDNGDRFDLRLPYVDQGWVDDGEKSADAESESVDFFQNLMSGGKLQREADERAKQKRERN